MNIDFNNLIGHKQITNVSCIPMSIEAVLKLIGLMPVDDFSLQLDETKSRKTEWISNGFSFPLINPKIKFSQEFLLSKLYQNKSDRGLHFMCDHFEDLFKTIDSELYNNRCVIISLQSGSNQWHMEIIYNKIEDSQYQTFSFYHNESQLVIFQSKDLRKRVAEMQGTDIFTYKFIS